MTIGRMNRMFKHAHDNHEDLVKVKALMKDGKLPKGILIKS